MSLALMIHSSSTTTPVDNNNNKSYKLFMALESSGGPKIIDSSMLHQFKNEHIDDLVKIMWRYIDYVRLNVHRHIREQYDGLYKEL